MTSPAKHPILDNTETSASFDFSPNPSYIQLLKLSDYKKLYTEVERISYYKKLTDNIASTLLLCSTADDFEFGDTLQKLLMCGTKLVLDDDGKVVNANFCRLRICPMCQRRRSLRVASIFNDILDSLDCAWVHLVLTVPNCSASELSVVLDDMYKASSRLFNFAPIKKAFKGGIRCTEVTYNPMRDDYHPHLHCLISVNKSYFKSRYYLSSDFLRQAWYVLASAQMFEKQSKKVYDVTGSHVIDHVSVKINVRNKSDSWIEKRIASLHPDQDILYQISITKADRSAVPEIAKYCVKPLEMSLTGYDLFEPLKVIFEALHSRRLLLTWGNVKEASRSLGVELDTDTDEGSEGELPSGSLHRLFWNRKLQKYE